MEVQLDWVRLFNWYHRSSTDTIKVQRSSTILFTKVTTMEYETLCAIWYHFYNLKTVKNTYGGVLLLIKLLASACNFTKSNTPPWLFFTFFKLYKWYKIAKGITYIHHKLINIKRFLIVTCFFFSQWFSNVWSHKNVRSSKKKRW